MKALTFAWGARYVALAARLEASCARFGVEIEVVTRPGEPRTREEAWAVRPSLILNRLAGRPVIYVDADAVLHAEPPALPEWLPSPYDFAAVRYPGRDLYRLGMWVTFPTPRAEDVLRGMIRRLPQDAYVHGNDEPVFMEEVRKAGAKVYDLPAEYCWCEAWNDRKAYGNRKPIVEVNA